MSCQRFLNFVRRLDRDERGEINTTLLIYLAIGAILAAALYKFGGRLLSIVNDFIGSAEKKKPTLSTPKGK